MTAGPGKTGLCSLLTGCRGAGRGVSAPAGGGGAAARSQAGRARTVAAGAVVHAMSVLVSVRAGGASRAPITIML